VTSVPPKRDSAKSFVLSVANKNETFAVSACSAVK
jgi:hypothetical protein